MHLKKNEIVDNHQLLDSKLTLNLYYNLTILKNKMKTKLHIAILFMLVLLSSISNAQTFTVEKSELSYENDLRPCLVTTVDPSTKELKKAWVKYVKKNLGVKIKGIGFFSDDAILKAEDVIAPSIAPNRFNLYTRIAETPSGSQMKVFASFGYDLFINENNYPTEFDNIKMLMNDFLYETLNEYYTAETKSLNKATASYNKNKLKELKSINSNEKKLVKTDVDIAKNTISEYDTTETKIKKTKALNKLFYNKTKMEKENSESKINIQNLENQIKTNLESIEALRNSHNGLIK
jgi:hypothetical protein